MEREASRPTDDETVVVSENAKRVKELEDRLAEKKEAAKLKQTADEESLPTFQYHEFTQLRRGTIRDIDVKETHRHDNVQITVAFDDGETTVIRYPEPTTYDMDNGLVRLLEWKGVTTGEIGSLLNESVLVKTDRGELAVPNNFDTFGKAAHYTAILCRLLGFTQIEEFFSASLMNKLLGGLTVYMIGVCLMIIPVLALAELGVPESTATWVMLFGGIIAAPLSFSVWRAVSQWYTKMQERREARQDF